MSPDQWATSTATALGIAMGMLTLFITGVITTGKNTDRLMGINDDLRRLIDGLTAAFAKANEVHEQRLRWEQQWDDRRLPKRPRE